MKKKEMLELKRFGWDLASVIILFISSLCLTGCFYLSAWVMFNKNFIGGFILVVLFGISDIIVSYKNFKFAGEIVKKLR